jgi:hypothetical protein
LGDSVGIGPGEAHVGFESRVTLVEEARVSAGPRELWAILGLGGFKGFGAILAASGIITCLMSETGHPAKHFAQETPDRYLGGSYTDD